MIGFTKSVALELGSRNIRCNAIAPGFIETEMTAVLDEKTVQGWREGVPMKRGGQPEDIANACLFLGSEMSSYITGQTLNVDGECLLKNENSTEYSIILVDYSMHRSDLY